LLELRLMRRLPQSKAKSPRCYRISPRIGRVSLCNISTLAISRRSQHCTPPNDKFVAGSGETIVGRDQVRDVLARMIRSKTKLQSRVIKAISVDDVAVLYTDFQGATMDASEKTMDVRYNTVEVLRRQPNGCWKLIVGDPNRRE